MELGNVPGYKGNQACKAVGITYRQLDYWARTGLVAPSVQQATGSGTIRYYSFQDVLELKIVKRLLDTGVSLQNIRTAIEHLRDQGIEDLSAITLMSDGASIYECRTDDEVIDILKGGQAVFGIAIGVVSAEVAGTLASLPVEEPVVASEGVGTDELSLRRARRISAS